MSGGQEYCAEQARKKLQAEAEEIAIRNNYRLEEMEKRMGRMFINLLEVAKIYEELREKL